MENNNSNNKLNNGNDNGNHKEENEERGADKKQIQEIGYIKPREIVDEMKDSYIDYAMSVIVTRALPDVRDGLKPVHRRILYTMMEEGLRHNVKFRKSATVVGSTLGRYHPHGDMAVYDSLVRMAQDFSLRYPLVQGQGNFGCFTKDTKVKLTDGRSLNFTELIKEQKQGKKHWTFSFNSEVKKIEITEVKNPRLTRKNEKIMEVELDNGEKIKCTLDHRFMTRDGNYEQAKNLKPRNSLMPAYFNTKRIRSHYNYLAVLQPFTNHYEFVHRLADEYNARRNDAKKIKKPYILHHKDFNKYNNSPDNIERFTIKQHYKIHLKQAKNLWKTKGDEFREKHRQSLKRVFSNPAIRLKISENSKKLWKDPKYRNKYPKEHFSKMAQQLWKNPNTKKFHSEKAKKQWENPEFRKNFITGIIAANKKRIEKNPNFMKELAQKAKISLRKNWKNSDYKKRIIRNKILGYVYNLSKKYPKITPDIYNKERYNNCFPRFENAIKYFNDFPEILDKAQKYNHKVIATKILKGREDVYDLTTEPCHNFLLGAGVFVHNSIDSDPAAASRYTEARMSKIGEEMLKNIEKETVDFRDNYDATRKEPVVLPSPVPQLLLNGTLGIAVGMATSIPPHNLSEVVDATIHLIDNPKADTRELFKFIKGPDFPLGGMIYNQKDIIEAYSVGKGPIEARGKAEIIEDKKGRDSIIITEIPYQVQKSGLVQQIAKLVQEKKITGVKTVRDESDRDGMRIVIEMSKDAFPQKILNRLYKFSDLQKTFHINMLALVDGIQPKVLSLSEVLTYFVEHKKQVVIRRTEYDLKKAQERAHILEGLHKCLSKIDEVIRIIKASKNREDAQNNLIKKFKLTEIQANAILEMKLANLAKLERQRIEDELEEKQKMIKAFKDLLSSPKKIKDLMKKELQEMKDAFGDDRRTKVFVQKIGEIAEEDLIPQEETIVTLTHGGYIKRINPDIYKIQKRGGKGIMGMKTLGEDVIEHFISCQTHDSLMFFTDSGRVFKVPAYEIPEGTRVAKGRGILNFLEITPQEKILSVFSIGKEDEELGIRYLVMATKNGIIKRTELNDFKNVRRSGLIAITLKKNDALQSVCKSTGKDEIILITKQGQSIRFKEEDIRPMSRIAAGNMGIRLKKADELKGMDVIKPTTENYLLVLTENGYGKRTNLKEYRLQGRGGSGIKTANITSKTGGIKATKILTGKEEDLIVISQKGQVIRTSINTIAKLGRPTQGVKIMRLGKGDKVASGACM